MENLNTSQLNEQIKNLPPSKKLRKKQLIVGRYEVVHTLAGGMGIVYLCRDHLESRLVALKTFKPEFLSHVGARDLFLREGTMWVEIGRHPHIVRAHRVERTADGLEVYLVLNWVLQPPGKDNPSLRAWLKPGQPLPVKLALTFALHIARGMKYATGQIAGLVHRDLKPENVLIGHDGNARVTDFGLASTLSEMNLGNRITSLPNSRENFGRTQLTQGIAGTPLYMAPEQWQHQSIDARADIYALGCILYEMVTGRFAAEGETREALRAIHLNGRIKPPSPTTHPAVIAFLRHCMMLKPAQRLRNWREVEEALLRIYWTVLDEEPPEEGTADSDTPEERLAAGQSYNAMGLSYLDIGKLAVAVMYFEQAVWIARAEKSLELEGEALGNLGLAYRALGYIDRAVEFHEEHYAIARQLEDLAEEGRALGDLGRAYRNLGDYPRAISYHQRQLIIAQGLNDRFKEASALYSLGDTYRQLKDEKEAVKYYKQSLAIARDLGDRARVKNILSSMGHIYLESGESKAAAALFHQALEMSRGIADRVGEGKAFSDLGYLYTTLGYTQRAIEFYTYALNIAQESNDWRQRARNMTNLGDIYFELGDAHKAKEYCMGALTAVQEVSDQVNAMKLFDKLGLIHQVLKEYMEAASFHRRALMLAQDLRNPQMIQDSIFNLGKAYEKWGDAGRAVEYYKQNLATAEAEGDWQSEIKIYISMGDLYRKLNQIGFTRESYGNALEIAQTHQHTVSIVNILVKLGNMSRDLGDIRQAVESYKEAASVAHDGNDLRGEAIAMSNLGDMYGMMGRNWQAVRSAEKGLKLAEKAGDDNSLMWTNYRLGMLHYKQEKWSKARPFIIKAEQLFAKARMQEMIEDTQRIRADLDRQEYGT